MNKIAFIMVGVAGAGKSTIVEKLSHHFESQNEDAYIFSLDSIRLQMLKSHLENLEEISTADFYSKAYEFCNLNKEQFQKLIDSSWSNALDSNNVIVDNVNLTRKSRTRWITDLKRKNFKIVAVQVIAPLDVIIQRQLTRLDKCVPTETVKDMYFKQQEVLLSVEADKVITVDGTDNCTKVESLIAP